MIYTLTLPTMSDGQLGILRNLIIRYNVVTPFFALIINSILKAPDQWFLT